VVVRGVACVGERRERTAALVVMRRGGVEEAADETD